MNKFRLVPETQFQQWQNASNKSSIVQSIKYPEQNEMIKQYNIAQNVLKDADLPEELQLAKFKESMHEFNALKNKLTPSSTYGKSIQTQPAVKNNNAVESNLVDALPTSLQRPAQLLLNQMRGNENIISWTPRGEVSLYGKRLDGNNNLTDLVADVLRNTKTTHENRSSFLNALRDLNTPSTLIKNKNALRDFQQNFQRPPGIPDELVVPKTDDDDDDDDEEEVKWPRHKR